MKEQNITCVQDVEEVCEDFGGSVGKHQGGFLATRNVGENLREHPTEDTENRPDGTEYFTNQMFRCSRKSTQSNDSSR